MPTRPHTLDQILDSIQRPGDFHANGTIEFFAPNLTVEGVGRIALPLMPAQAEALIAVAERAPYGRGEETLVNTEVRRTWQIGADQIHISGRHWDHSLTSIVARCAAGLGVTEPVSAELYKMLIYDTGSFFVGHRDTEKVAGMFATLVIVLPSVYSGGELVVRHRDREVCLDLACDDSAEVSFAAFYADCVHEVRPITDGCRLVLVYNLVRPKATQPLLPPAYDTEVEQLADLLRQWSADRDAPGMAVPAKLIYPLEHVYTPAEIAFASLKNGDGARAAVLAAAAGQAQCELHLALVAIHESGSAEYTGEWSRGRRYAEPEDEDFEVGEVFERTLTLSNWQRSDHARPDLPDLPFNDDELCPPDAFESEEPDEQLFFEATGNAGASFERSYRRAALVVWPKTARLNIIAEAGLSAALPYLDGLVQRWTEGDDDIGSPTWHEVHQLAGAILREWPIRHDHEPGGKPGDAACLLTNLSRLRDCELIVAALRDLCAQGHYAAEDNEAIARAAACLPLTQATEWLERIIQCNAAWQTAACANLLVRLTLDTLARSADAAIHLQGAAAAVLAAQPGDPARAPQPDGWRRPAPLTPDTLVDLLTALYHLDARSMAESAVDHWLAWPQHFPLDPILVPAALRLSERSQTLRQWAPCQRLIDACLAHLARRIAEPLEPPPDFARPSQLACRCSHCTQLAAFLAHTERKTWVFKSAEANRQHVEQTILRHACDVDTETDRSGRPYSLVCTKNQNSYQRRVVQRNRDLLESALLRNPPAPATDTNTDDIADA